MGRVAPDVDDLIEHWTLLGGERDLVTGKRGATRLGFALLLRFYGQHGRFPTGRSELVDEVVEFVAVQVDVPASELGFYAWTGRTIEYHRAQIRDRFGFRECSVAEGEKITAWLAATVCEQERRTEQVLTELLAHCRSERIEPPAAGRLDRMVRSALRSSEQTLTVRVSTRLRSSTVSRLVTLIATEDRDVEAGDGGGEPTLLALIRREPGNVSLDTTLSEIDKLGAIRAVGLPRGLFDDVAARLSSGGGRARPWSRRHSCAITRRRCSSPCWPRCCMPGAGRENAPLL